MRIFIAVFLLASNMILYSCSDVTGISEPYQERMIDWVIQNRPQDLVAVVGVFPETVRPDGGGGNVQKLVLFDYYNPENYKIATDTTYRVTDPVFSHGKTKIIFGDTRRYIFDVGPSLVLYDIVQNTFERLLIPVASTLAGINVVWDVNDMGFYFSNEPAFGQSVYYYDLSSNTHTAVSRQSPMRTYPVELLPPDTLIVFTNDTEVTEQPKGLYYMNTNGQFLSRINNGYLKSGGKIKWNNTLQLFVFEELGHFLPNVYMDWRIALTDRDGTYYKYFPLTSNYREGFTGWNSHEMKLIVLLSLERPGNIGIWGSYGMKIMLLDYQTGEMRKLVSPEIITSCIAFAWAVY